MVRGRSRPGRGEVGDGGTGRCGALEVAQRPARFARLPWSDRVRPVKLRRACLGPPKYSATYGGGTCTRGPSRGSDQTLGVGARLRRTTGVPRPAFSLHPTRVGLRGRKVFDTSCPPPVPTTPPPVTDTVDTGTLGLDLADHLHLSVVEEVRQKLVDPPLLQPEREEQMPLERHQEVVLPRLPDPPHSVHLPGQHRVVERLHPLTGRHQVHLHRSPCVVSSRTRVGRGRKWGRDPNTQ